MASVEEIEAAVAAGAHAVGLVGEMPSGAGVIGIDRAAILARSVPAGVESFYLSSAETAAALAREVSQVRPTTLQIVRHVAPAIYPELRRAAPGVRLVQVVHVEDAGSLATASAYAGLADALLLDSGRPTAGVAELGGTGRTHDWSLSARIIRATSIPVYLAGGLNASNVRAAIEAVRPFALDFCSGVRTNDKLDASMLAALVTALRG